MIIAVIPARGGSKGIQLKNLRRVGGRSLLSRAVTACQQSGAIDRIVVSTDHPQIATEAMASGAEVIERPSNISGDLASSESVLLHVLESQGVAEGVLAFVQCTSPFIEPERLAEAVEIVKSGRADTVFSATRTWDFLWSFDSARGASGVNHDPSVRARRQELPITYRETGGFYAMNVAGFLRVRHRFFGKIVPVEVDRSRAIDIDEPVDLEVARAIESRMNLTKYLPDFSRVQAFVMDFDGVHTDDCAHLHEDGSEHVRISRADGMGIRMLRESGLPMLILSSEVNPVVAQRANKLQVSLVQGTLKKKSALLGWLQEIGVEPQYAAYIGNDLNDLECLEAVGFPIAVRESPSIVLDTATYVTANAGGSGAVREVADLLLASRMR